MCLNAVCACVLHLSPFHTGDVQIGLMDKKGQLEVEVTRARGLTPKPGSKSLPGNTHAHLITALVPDDA